MVRATHLMALFLLASCAHSAPPSPASPGPEAKPKRAAVHGFTLLRSHSRDPTELVAFIRKHWFAMDEVARQQGLLTDYRVFAAPRAEDADWNVVVVVGYADPAGYSGIAEAFEELRRRHNDTTPGAGGLNEVGTVVGSRELAAPFPGH